MIGISLERTAFQFLFITFILLIGLGVYIMACGIDRMIEAMRKDERQREA